MKICAIICEYNPFHNGHLHHIRQAKTLSNADALVCIMSGNFVQRGESAIMEKRHRAKHAVLAGADAVVELPVIFATSNAELFAKGAVKILSAIPSLTHLCFGAENANADVFLRSAKILNDEPMEISAKIKDLTAQGYSYAKAKTEAFKDLIPAEFLENPNNLLGLEYTRAILSYHSKIQILPIQRLGCGYADTHAQENFSSATAIRKAIQAKDFPILKTNLPSFVYDDLTEISITSLQPLLKYAILQKNSKEIAKVCDCTEGLENAFKRVAEENVEQIESALTSARYTTSRIRRIALQNLLNIQKQDILSALENPLYLRLLAIKKENVALLSELGKSAYPLLVKNSDEQKLDGVALEIYQKEKFADRVYSIATGKQFPSFQPLL